MTWLSPLLGSWRPWNRCAVGRARSPGPGKRPPETWLSLETLETRCLMSATLVADLNTQIANSNPGEFTASGRYLFFEADDGIHGRELWRTDGTPTGTKLVKDINRGGAGSINVFPADLTDVNGTLFFPADDGVHGIGLWKSDGTAAGTVLVKDFSPGSYPAGPYHLTNVNGTLFFSVNGGPTDIQGLWKSDGTTAGTVLVSNAVDPADLINVNGTLLFLGFDPVHTSGLWKSDGTAAGTVFLKQVAQNAPPEMVDVNGTLFFTWDGGLWKSDGTARGTKRVAVPDDLQYPEHLTNVDGTLYFQAAGDPAVNPHRELWKTDGTKRGTVVVKNINPNGNAFQFQGEYPMAGVDGMLYFRAFDGTNSGLWKSDGTATGTVLVSSAVTPAFGQPLVNANGTLYFSGSDGLNGDELWRSDGTPAGTVLVRDINPGSAGSNPSGLTNLNGTLVFSANDGTDGNQLWMSHGTAADTVMLKDIYPGNQSSDPSNLTPLNGSLYFLLAPQSGGGLWTSDGTAAGTVEVANVAGVNLTAAGGLLYFSGPGSRFGNALWESDGTTAGTVRVKDLGGLPGGPAAQNLTDVNGTLYFTVGTQLWASNGTPNGTVELLATGTPEDLTNVNGTLFFTLDDGIHGRELWESDSTAGPHLVADINPNGASSNPQSLINLDGILYFSADDGVHGRQLWQSDGTAVGTVLAANINPGGSADPTDLTVSNGFVYFAATTPATGRELWQYDPSAGTATVFDINPGTAGSNPSSLTDVNGELFFAANDGVHGKELWATDGTQAGTHFVADIHPGSVGSNPEYLDAWNGLLYFTADDGPHGRELWQSDGTAAGTSLVQDINPGKGSAFYSFDNPYFTVVNNQLFFVANDRIHGRELWVYTPDSAPRTPAAEQRAALAQVSTALAGRFRSSPSPAPTAATAPVMLPAIIPDHPSPVESRTINRGAGIGSDQLATPSVSGTAGEAFAGIDLPRTADGLLDEAFMLLAQG